MPSVAEKPMSRSGTDGESARRVYSCLDYASPGAAVDATNSYIVARGETLWEGLVLRKFSYDDVAPRVYEVTAEYGTVKSLLPPPATGSITFDFDIATETQHINVARGRVANYILPGYTDKVPGLNDLLIGVGIDGDVQGQDILVPTSRWGISIHPANTQVTEAYRVLCGGLVCRVNNAPFQGRQAGEVMFAGLRGSERSADDSELRLEFLERKNETGIQVGGISGINKAGWDILNFHRAMVPDPAASNRPRPTVVAVSVDQIYLRGDFGQLLI